MNWLIENYIVYFHISPVQGIAYNIPQTGWSFLDGRHITWDSCHLQQETYVLRQMFLLNVLVSQFFQYTSRYILNAINRQQVLTTLMIELQKVKILNSIYKHFEMFSLSLSCHPSCLRHVDRAVFNSGGEHYSHYWKT